MKKSLLFAMALGLAFSACSKEEVPLYDTENANFIEFVGATEDTTAFSFMFHPEVAAGGAYDLAIPVRILGQRQDRDREFTHRIIHIPWQVAPPALYGCFVKAHSCQHIHRRLRCVHVLYKR